jgi:hypothetical protein
MPHAYQLAASTDEAIAVLRGQVERGWRRHDLVEEFVGLVRSGTLIMVPVDPC